MRVVRNAKEIEKNIGYLDTIRASREAAAKAAYCDLIKRGTCFLPYVSGDGLAFAPSRFVGYVDNELAAHAVNESRDGRITNIALTAVLGSRPQSERTLEKIYCDFCHSLGFEPRARAPFGVERKYWATAEAKVALNDWAGRAIDTDVQLSPTERVQLAKARVGQGIFRQALIDHWVRCCVTGCDIVSILRASHIKPWHAATNKERLDVYNGLLLSPNLDALFDQGFISFEDNGMLLIAKALPKKTASLLGIPSNLRLRLNRKHWPYLEYHRTIVFRGPYGVRT